jgi:hypothetical protein
VPAYYPPNHVQNMAEGAARRVTRPAGEPCPCPVGLKLMENTKKDIVLLVVTTIAVACLGLAACSSIENAPLDPGPPPDFLKVKPLLMSVANEYRIAEGLEVAGPIRAHPVSSIPWIMCLRSASTPRKTYAAFFKGDEYIRSRMSVIEDRCDGESYRPFPK